MSDRRDRRSSSRALATYVAVVLAATALPAAAGAQQIASVGASFSPYRLGGPTALSLGFDVSTVDGELPSALTGVEFRYPRTIGLATSELGLASCKPATLELGGPKACPPNSIMGHGSALAQFQVSPIVSEERASLAVVAGPSPNGYLHLLISATGAYPVSTRIVMSTLLLPGRLQISVPLVPGVPEGPDVAVANLHLTIGGELTYYEPRHGRRVAYRPRGVQLPQRCPRGGFHFSAMLSFLDGTTAQARTVVKCPAKRRDVQRVE